ncbi:AraC family transcriptional regulator [Paenibacillus harenae]|uniref:AraC family transcriptional regulator n=1 Tax=Paenibacillus harenae TaxID=306543 RepID=UPI00040F559B|nr:AraC family transcriptional regulator [Paenibacillus harenae]
MNSTVERILQNQLNRIHPEVIISAYSEYPPGWSRYGAEPDFNRLCYIHKGQGWLEIENKRYHIMPGGLYFLPAGTVQSYGTAGDEPFGCYWCHFRMEHGDAQFIQSLKLPLFVFVEDEHQIRQLFSKIIALQQNDTVTRGLRLKAVLLELITNYLDASHIQQKQLSDPDISVKWNEVLDYIEANLHTCIQVEELAKFAFLHPNYFIASFKNMMGCSPIQYVTNRRIAIAKQLLEETTLPITAIANQVGMQNHYLSRLFRRITGITPNHYRKLARTGHVETADIAHHAGEEGNGN